MLNHYLKFMYMAHEIQAIRQDAIKKQKICQMKLDSLSWFMQPIGIKFPSFEVDESELMAEFKEWKSELDENLRFPEALHAFIKSSHWSDKSGKGQ